MVQKCKEFFYKTNIGFTLIEMLISVSIMIIIGTFGVYSLQNYFTGYDTKKIAQKIIKDIDYFDSEIKASQNSSYELEFFSGETLGYLVNKNFFKKTNLIYLDNINFNQISGTLKTSNTSNGIWITKIYFDNLFKNSYIHSGSGDTINFLFSGATSIVYKINSFIDDNQTNEFNIIYFSKDNLLNEDAKKIKLISLSGANLYDRIKVRNILGNKEITGFIGASSWSIDSINLNFEKGGKDFSIEIKK